MNILISALGATPDIIEETIGIFNYNENVEFYQGNTTVKALRNDLERVDEVWLVATDQKHKDLSNGKQILSLQESFDYICRNCAQYNVHIRIFVLDGVDDIVNEDDARAFHDLLLRVVAYAHQQNVGGKLYLSLACGRKTMSTDMQDAAYIFGCDNLLHVLGDNKEASHPMLMGSVTPNEAIRVQNVEFDSDLVLRCKPSTSFLNDVEEQKQQSQHFFTSYYLNEKETRSNFHILYTLPPSEIARLKNSILGINKEKQAEEIEWLRQLPKTDLHCHLGGVLYPIDMIEVAECYIPKIEEELQYNRAYSDWVNQLKQGPTALLRKVESWKEWLNNKSKELEVEKGLITASIILTYKNNAEELGKLIFKNYWESECDYKQIGINTYEGLGDLQGSALLCNEAAIRRTVNKLTDRCRKENVKYLEVRCSPNNYENKSTGLSPDKILLAICEELNKAEELTSSLLIIASRHGAEEKIKHSIELVQRLKGNELFRKYFRGFDLAGDESAKAAKDVRVQFLEIMKECYNITIHVGETMPSESIWEAVYYLSAERIGHGLKLLESKELMDKLLERGIGIEMCPSSNYQIVGYCDNYYPNETYSLNKYPIKSYLEKGLRVSINTDDPGISLTDCTHELHKAARMTKGGLSKWDILQLICNGFRTAFFPYEKKKSLIRETEKDLGELIAKGKL